MTNKEFQRIRESLGLTVKQLALLLNRTPAYIHHMELPSSRSSSVPVPENIARIMEAYRDGYRPKDWP